MVRGALEKAAEEITAKIISYTQTKDSDDSSASTAVLVQPSATTSAPTESDGADVGGEKKLQVKLKCRVK
jgi:hypothetical protein